MEDNLSLDVEMLVVIIISERQTPQRVNAGEQFLEDTSERGRLSIFQSLEFIGASSDAKLPSLNKLSVSHVLTMASKAISPIDRNMIGRIIPLCLLVVTKLYLMQNLMLSSRLNLYRKFFPCCYRNKSQKFLRELHYFEILELSFP